MLMQHFGGQQRCIMGDVQVAYMGFQQPISDSRQVPASNFQLA